MAGGFETREPERAKQRCLCRLAVCHDRYSVERRSCLRSK
jgi:hypothetical protein